MAQDQATLAASWTAPTWAETSDTDEQAVVHSRHVGSLADLDGQQLRIDLVQRDDLCLTPGGATVVREPVWLRVAEARLSPDQARRMVKLLLRACRTADSRQAELLEHGWRWVPAISWQAQAQAQAQEVAVEGLSG